MSFESKYGAIPGHLPEKIRIEVIQEGYYGNGNPRKANQQYFDLQYDVHCKAATDWSELDLPDPSIPMANMYSIKSKKRGKDNILIDNKPIKVRLASAEQTWSYRSGAKENLQVLIPQGYVVDMQTDIFFEALMRDGWNHETKELNSEFIVVMINRSAKLVRIGSDLYKAVMERENREKAKKIDVKTMNVGEIYETQAGNRAIFLGFVTTRYMKSKDLVRDKNNNDVLTGNCAYSTMKIGTLWLNLQNLWWGDPKAKRFQTEFNNILQDPRRFAIYTSFKSKSGHGYVNKVNGATVDVPFDIVRTVRLTAIKELTIDLENIPRDKFANWIDNIAKEVEGGNKSFMADAYDHENQFHAPSWWDISNMMGKTKMTNMAVFGMKPDVHPKCKEIEDIIKLFNSIEERNLTKHVERW